MFHISDIEKLHKENPVPKEVLEMREHILDSFKNLEFVEEGHKYYLHNADGTIDEPISVSGLIKELEPFVDWDEKAEGKALKLGITKEKLKRQWEEKNISSTNSGAKTHLYGETLMKFIMGETEFDPSVKCQYERGYFIPYSPKEQAVVKYWEDILGTKEIYPLIPEVKMYMPKDNKYGIKRLYCGTADITLAYKKGNDWKILLHDYKTNYSLSNSYNIVNGNMMCPPFDDFVEESLSHYYFQLSAYSLMLNNLGYDIIDRKIIWLKDDGTYEKIFAPDLRDRIIKMYQ